jgi:hypothetical protein
LGQIAPGNHALAFCVALHGAAQLFDHAHRFVAHGQALGHRVFALEDVHVGAADGGGRDADQRIVGAHVGDGLVDQLDAAGFDENGGFHAKRLADLVARFQVGSADQVYAVRHGRKDAGHHRGTLGVFFRQWQSPGHRGLR